jgi:glycosyltransferase involved in cell wall biosynthesis
MLVKNLIRKKSRLVKTFWIKVIEQNNIELAGAIHVTSLEEDNELRKFSFSLSKIAIIANGVEIPTSWSENEISEDVRAVVKLPDYLLYFGRLTWKKGIDRLVKSLKNVPDTKLVIAGNDDDNYLQKLKQTVFEEALQDQVVFLVRSITGADKEALFASARLFVLPSYSENFGITVLEAMIRGLPVAVTNEVGAAEIVRQAGAGMVISAESLGKTINKMLLDTPNLELMGSKGMSWARKYYQWDTVARHMIDCYGAVLAAEGVS